MQKPVSGHGLDVDACTSGSFRAVPHAHQSPRFRQSGCVVSIPNLPFHLRTELALRSPDGKRLLTKLAHGVKIWTDVGRTSGPTSNSRSRCVPQEGVCKHTVHRHCPIQSVTWVPDGKGTLALYCSASRCANGRGVEFLSVETGVVARLVGDIFSL